MQETTFTPPQLTDITGLEHLVRNDEADSSGGVVQTKVKQAVSYLRVSSTRQLNTGADVDEHGNSIATQREWAIRKAGQLHAVVAAEFIEPGVSAKTIAARREFQNMLAYVEEHATEIDYVIIYARSRAFRNVFDAVVVERQLNDLGVQLISATEEFGEDEDTALAFKVITDTLNDINNRKNGRDIANKMQHKVEMGGTSGMAPLGYLNVPKEFDGRWVNSVDIDPVRAPVIQWAFETYATGEWTLANLQAELAEQGLTTRKTKSRVAHPLSESQLAVILRDPYYVGLVRYKGNLYPGRHTALIAKELFLTVQDVLSERARRGQRDRVHHHFLKGLLFCERCFKAGRDSRLVFTMVTGRGGIEYEYFVCRGRQDGHCDLPYVAVHEVEAAVLKYVGSQRLDPAFEQTLEADVLQELRLATQSQQEHVSALRREIKKRTVMEEQLYELAADGRLHTAQLKERILSVVLERQSLENQLDIGESALERGANTLLAYAHAYAKSSKTYRAATTPLRRQLIEVFFHRLLIDSDYGVTATSPLTSATTEILEAERVFRAGTPKIGGNTKSPRPKAGAQGLVRSEVSLADFFKSHVSSKADLVAGEGFEPSTSGL